MSRYLIEEVKCGGNDGGTACGPVGDVICVSVKYKKDDEPCRYLELDDVDGIPNFYLSNEDLFDFHMNFDAYEDEKEVKRFVKDYIEDFDGVNLSGDYTDLFNQLYGEQMNNPVTPLLKYVILAARCSDYDIEKIIELATGKYADEIDIPQGDVEQDYLAGLD